MSRRRQKGPKGRRRAANGLLDLPLGEPPIDPVEPPEPPEPPESRESRDDRDRERRNLDLFSELEASVEEAAEREIAAAFGGDDGGDDEEDDGGDDQSAERDDLAEELTDRHRTPGSRRDAATISGIDHTTPVTLTDRLIAGAADVLVHAGILAGVLIALTYLGAEPRLTYWPGLVGFLLCFSFLYITLPLAFWGQTPGMVWGRLKARDRGDQPLTYSQTVLRWLAGIATVALCGLPVLVALSGRSAADLLSRSSTQRAAGRL